MGIDARLVEQIVDLIGSHAPDVGRFEQLKKQFPEVRLTACFDEDIYTGKPVYASPSYAIYLVGNGDHCLSLTNDYAIATGVVVAEILPEE